MPFSRNILRIVSFSHSLSVAVLFILQTVGFALAEAQYLPILPRARPDPITISIQTLGRRSPADNTTFGAGVSWVTTSDDKQSFFTIIQAGNINFRVALDTGSSDLWLVSSACETETCKSVPRYPLAYQSPTFASQNGNATNFTAHYADSTFVSGFIARETLEVANLTIPNQEFGMVTDSNVTLTNQASGVLGLGFPRLSSISTGNDSLPFFSALASKGLLEYPLFGLSISRNSTGTLTLGAIDSSVVRNISDISWNKVAQFPPFGAENGTASYLQWAIPLDSFAVNGSELTPNATYSSTGRTDSLALFDIGSPGIYGPYQDVSRLFDMIDGARLVDPNGQWAVPCDTTIPFTFIFGLSTYTVLPTQYIIGPASGNPNLCLSWPMALPPNSDGIDWQMGSAFLQTVYSIFNFGINTKEPPTIGLYPLYNVTNITTETPADISSFLSAASATVATTFPNFLVPTPTFSTPPYGLNTSVTASIGGIVSTGLANTTYSALLGQKTSLANVSALPIITPPPSIVTLLVTYSGGMVSTTVSTHTMAAVTLGIPPGWSAGSALHPPLAAALVMPCIVLAWTLSVFAWMH